LKTTIPAPARPRPLLQRVLGRVPPQYAVLLIFGLLLLGLRALYRLPILSVFWPPVTRGQLSVRYALVMMGSFALASILGHSRRLLTRQPGAGRTALRGAAAMVGDWLPFILCLWVYENLHDLTSWIRPDTVDASLARADAWLFGVQPTLWLQRWITPLLDDYLALAYMMYFVFSPLLAGWLYLRGHVAEFKEFQLALLIAFYVGFLGYIAVPAVGPQLILKDQYTTPLTGAIFYYRIKHVVLNLQSFPRDCFPSMHTAASSVTLFFAWRARRRLPWPRLTLPVATILTASLWFSTVYLRYHWAVDVIAGWVVTLIACAGGLLLLRWWPRREVARPPAELEPVAEPGAVMAASPSRLGPPDQPSSPPP